MAQCKSLLESGISGGEQSARCGAAKDDAGSKSPAAGVQLSWPAEIDVTKMDIPNGRFCQRWSIVCCDAVTRATCECNCLFYRCRKLVSTNKVRYDQDGYSLDLAYITPRIITHGFPAAGLEHMYRNPRYEVRRFLQDRHGAKYFVFNFCAEPGRCYPASVFDGRVYRFPYRDHQVPRLHVLHQFCETAGHWLQSDAENVAALHCKAGKGRAGMMACCLLLKTGVRGTADEAIALYNEKRVRRKTALTVPSQIRFVHYYEIIHSTLSRHATGSDATFGAALRGNPPQRHIRRIMLRNAGTSVLADGVCLKLTQQTGCFGDQQTLWNSERTARHTHLVDTDVAGNFSIVLSTSSSTKTIGRCWMNTTMIFSQQIVLGKLEIDKFHRDRKHKHFPADLSLVIVFGDKAGTEDVSGKAAEAQVPEAASKAVVPTSAATDVGAEAACAGMQSASRRGEKVESAPDADVESAVTGEDTTSSLPLNNTMILQRPVIGSGRSRRRRLPKAGSRRAMVGLRSLQREKAAGGAKTGD